MAADSAQNLLDALAKQGLKPPVLQFALYQAANESGDFTSHVFTAANNALGIQFVNQAAAYDSTIKKSDGGTFAGYANFDDLATDFIRVISRQAADNTIGAPINATDLQDYVNRLDANNYFGDGDPADYLAALQRYQRKYQDLTPTVEIPKRLLSLPASVTSHEKLVIAITVTVIILGLLFLITKKQTKK